MEAGRNVGQSGASSKPQADRIIIVIIRIGYIEYTHV